MNNQFCRNSIRESGLGFRLSVAITQMNVKMLSKIWHLCFQTIKMVGELKTLSKLLIHTVSKKIESRKKFK